jgi:hypothetical protein
MKFKFYFSVVLALAFYSHLDAQPREKLVKVTVTQNHSNWNHEVHLKKSTNEKNIPKFINFVVANHPNNKLQIAR